MRPLTPLCWRCVLLVVTLASSAVAWAGPQGWVINSRGDFTDSSRVGALWSVDLASGEARLEGRSRISEYIFIEGISIRADERLYGVDDDTNTLVRIGLSTGNVVPVNQSRHNLGLPLGNHDFGLSFTCDDRLLMSTDSATLGSSLYEIDPETGDTILIGGIGAPIVDLATIGESVFGIGRGVASDGHPASPNLYRIDINTGRAERIGALGAEAGAYHKAGLASAADGTLWAVLERRQPSSPAPSEASQIVRIDPHTGRAEHVAELQAVEFGQPLVGVESLAIAPPLDCGRGIAPLEPEPVPVNGLIGGLIMMLGVLLLAGFRLHRVAAS